MVMSRVWCCCWCCCRRRVFSGEGQRRGRPSGADGTRRRQRDGSKAKLAKFFGIFYSMDDELEEDNNSSSNRKGQPEPIGKEDAETEPMIWRRRGEEEEAAASSSQMRQQKELADSATVPSTVSSSKCVMEAKGQHRFALKFEDTEYIVDVNSRGAADREAEGAVQQQNFRLYRRSHSLAGKVPPALPNLLSSSSPAQIRPKMSVVGRVASLFVSDDSSAASSTAGGEGTGGAGGGGAGGGGTRRKRPSLLGMIGVGGQRGRRSVSAFIPALFQRQKSGETETVAESDAPGEEERQRRMVGDAVENWSRQFSSTSPNGRRRRRRHETNKPFSSSQCADAVLLPTVASPVVHVQPRQKMPSMDRPVRFCAPFPAMPAQVASTDDSGVPSAGPSATRPKWTVPCPVHGQRHAAESTAPAVSVRAEAAVGNDGIGTAVASDERLPEPLSIRDTSRGGKCRTDP